MSLKHDGVKEIIISLIKKNPGIDSEEIARQLILDDGWTSDVVQELLREGRLNAEYRVK